MTVLLLAEAIPGAGDDGGTAPRGFAYRNKSPIVRNLSSLLKE
jgi:hypothetical protein